MTNSELLAKIKAEIERRMDKHWEGLPNADAPEDDWTHNELCELGAYKELEHLETFLSTLESEKPNDLEEAAKKFVGYDMDCDELRDYEIGISSFKAGAKWQKQHDAKLIEIAYNDGITIGMTKQKEQTEKRWLEDRDGCFWDGVEEGKKAMKEQMMKEAVEGEIQMRYSGCLCAKTIRAINEDKFKLGDKVKIIIVKED